MCISDVAAAQSSSCLPNTPLSSSRQQDTLVHCAHAFATEETVFHVQCAAMMGLTSPPRSRCCQAPASKTHHNRVSSIESPASKQPCRIYPPQRCKAGEFNAHSRDCDTTEQSGPYSVTLWSCCSPRNTNYYKALQRHLTWRQQARKTWWNVHVPAQRDARSLEERGWLEHCLRLNQPMKGKWIQWERIGGWDQKEQEALGLWKAECVWVGLALHCGHTGRVSQSAVVATASLSEKNIYKFTLCSYSSVMDR